MLLRDLLENVGVSATVISFLNEQEYRESSRKRGWRKLRLRLAMYVGYPLHLLARAVTAPKSSVFIVTSNTFYAPLLVAGLGKIKKFRTIQLVYDLFPDALEISGAITRQGRAAQITGCVARITQQVATTSVYLGEFLQQHAENRWGSPQSSGSAIHIGADTTLFCKEVGQSTDGPLYLHYGGQLGYMHDAESLLLGLTRVVESTEPRLLNLRVNMLLSGAHANRARTELKSSRISVEDSIISSEWRKRIEHFHIGLVSLSPGGATVCLPSKTYSMMAGGLAIIAICPVWSDLGKLILRHEAGWVVNNSPYSSASEMEGAEYMKRVSERRPTGEVADAFLSQIAEVSGDRGELQRRRKNAKSAVECFYSRSCLGDKWSELLRLLT